MNLCQYFTPLWVAEALVERHFPHLDGADMVLEPSCGRGAFLRALPSYVPGYGIEIDAELAARTEAETGRKVVVGDFRTVEIGIRPTAVIGNPPFIASAFDVLLERCHNLLPDGGRAGFILPVYFLRTTERVCRIAERWSVAHELLPRGAFHIKMRTPLTFAVFSKDRRRLLVGFALFQESEDVRSMEPAYRRLVESTTGSAWRAVCELALTRLGGEATLTDIYRELERNRPSHTRFWREKIRQTLRIYAGRFTALGVGRYALRG